MPPRVLGSCLWLAAAVLAPAPARAAETPYAGMQERPIKALSAEQVAADLFDAMADGRFLVLPHPEVAQMYANRAADPDRWLAGMRRMAAGLPAVTMGTD